MFKDAKEAYKAGFLLKLAELGITPDEFYESLVKQGGFLTDALSGVAGFGSRMAGKGVDLASNVVSSAKDIGIAGMDYAVPAAVLLPLFAGTGLGALHSSLNAPTEEDIDAVRQRELLKTYEALTRESRERARRQHAEAEEDEI